MTVDPDLASIWELDRASGMGWIWKELGGRSVKRAGSRVQPELMAEQIAFSIRNRHPGPKL